MSRFKEFTALAVATVGLVLAGSAMVAHADSNHDEHSVVGSWQLSIHDDSGAPKQGMIAFSPGGGLTSVDQLEVAGPGPVTAGVGAWEMTGSRSFTVHFVEYLGLPQGHVGTLTVISSGHLDSSGNSFTATGRVQAVDDQGHVLFTAPDEVTGTRMSADD